MYVSVVPVEHLYLDYSLSVELLVYIGKAGNLLVAFFGPKAAASVKKMCEFPDAMFTDSLLPGHAA